MDARPALPARPDLGPHVARARAAGGAAGGGARAARGGRTTAGRSPPRRPGCARAAPRSRAGTARSRRPSGSPGSSGSSSGSRSSAPTTIPLVMAEYRLTGEAFAGAVVDADLTRLDTDGKKPKLRPWLIVRTTDAVIVEPGTAAHLPGLPEPDGQGHRGRRRRPRRPRPANPANDRAKNRARTGRTLVTLELSGGMGRALAAPPGSTPARGDAVTYTTLQGRLPARAAVPEPGGDAVDPRRPAAGVRPHRRRRPGAMVMTELAGNETENGNETGNGSAA